jgi:hypothetical protein
MSFLFDPDEIGQRHIGKPIDGKVADVGPPA